jgi:hypothetical protein
LLHLHLPI